MMRVIVEINGNELGSLEITNLSSSRNAKFGDYHVHLREGYLPGDDGTQMLGLRVNQVQRVPNVRRIQKDGYMVPFPKFLADLLSKMMEPNR